MYLLAIMVMLLPHTKMAAQKKDVNLIYVDKEGVLRYTKNKKEAIFFGVNYTVPFAYGYRSHKALGINPEQAIDADVYHMGRLGLDAFRVHVWDVEISDSSGNLLQNEHLRLFDYLVKKLKERNIKLLITPIAFWGNGYPEPDKKTVGFASVYGKRPSVVKEEAFRAQERYLQQFLTHVNPYTTLSYKDDPDVIAMEINNEPQHSGSKERTTEYVQRMKAAVLSTGWTKPIFYNISESPTYANAVVKGNVDGYSFQWYPTGLVANREIKGNFLPHVDQYSIPFSDTIKAFRNKARMVYEFDAGDVGQPVMYPAMARSYRAAGFGWATQFAYDPMYTAYANTEYQTHYLNLAYTPAKAISLLIASKVFHNLPLGKGYGTYPADTAFGDFRVSYRQGLSEMNSEEEFYYTGTTTSLPKNISKLKHLAGVGTSPVVEYEGTGAYFLDKISNGLWRLEVMPDAVAVKDPFEKASPKKGVTNIYWRKNRMKIGLLDVNRNYVIKGMNKGNDYRETFDGTRDFFVGPGIYSIELNKKSLENFSIGLVDFYAPPASATDPLIVHQPLTEVSAGKPLVLHAIITSTDTSDMVSVEVRNTSNQWKTITAERISAYSYKATIPKDVLAPGIISYRMFIKKFNGDTYTFPGGFKGDPYAWDEYRNETWQTFVASEQSPIELFHATRDRDKIVMYNTNWRSNRVEYIAADDPGRLALKTTMTEPAAGQLMGWQAYFGDKISGRKGELPAFTKLVIKARSAEEGKAHISLIDEDATAYGASVALSREWKTIELAVASLQKDSMLLLPRPYPGFQPLWFVSSSKNGLRIERIEKLEVRFAAVEAFKPASIEVQWIRLKK